ncbi:hypothetical protein VIGAN_11112800 [Vigna angularis var. angularis]|uniref:Uncharacterized protein n=1 Tax=Vigna angularis var. angularis TaxID=157739 RepID=A0A0S3T9A8_PHAAN|nr:hypothetical protein VIGAN_11112800 [Vigna angularis var. angularis]
MLNTPCLEYVKSIKLLYGLTSNSRPASISWLALYTCLTSLHRSSFSRPSFDDDIIEDLNKSVKCFGFSLGRTSPKSLFSK